jgi:putative peptidoglycan lipid II flippase
MNETNLLEPQEQIANAKRPAGKATAPMGRVLSFATITAFGFVLGKVSGILREMVVSARFGLSAQLDAYFLAGSVPTIINNVVAGSAITAAIMPTFARYLATRAEGEPRAARAEFWFVASILTNIVLLITGALTILAMAFAAPIISILGSRLDAPTAALATNLLAIMMPTLLLGAALNMLMAMLNSLDRFTAPALIFLALNVGIIGTVILFSPALGVYAVAWGFLIGVGLQVAVQLIELQRERPQYQWRIDWRHPALGQVLRAFIPIAALSIVAQINLLVDRTMAATLPAGSVSALYYADSVLGMFYMLGISLGIAVFPSLSRMAAMHDLACTARTVDSSLRLLILILMPLVFLLILFGAPIVGLILGRGEFDPVAVARTAQALTMYAIGLIGIAAIYVLQRAFFALLDNVTPFIVGAGAAALHIGLNLLFMPFWSHAGIALSTSVTALAGAIALTLLLTRRVPHLNVADLLVYILQCAVMALVCAAAAFWLFSVLNLGVETLTARIIGTAVAAVGALAYFALALLMGVSESKTLVNVMLGFVRRKK